MPRLPFPLSHPKYVLLSQRAGDDWVDVGTIRDTDLLDPESRAALESVLAETYFIPRVKRVLSLSTTGDEFVWEVETDKGMRKFSTRGRRNVISDGRRLILIDTDTNVYVVEDVASLDKGSRSYVERFLRTAMNLLGFTAVEAGSSGEFLG
ncbi:MAG: DUF1854 domain-containing protein [TACK group archaeon]|nr:DUF1854 domain-containing protein [TACK group archaeon]